jgi:hypothetical protein
MHFVSNPGKDSRRMARERIHSTTQKQHCGGCQCNTVHTQILMPRFQPKYGSHFLDPVYVMIPRRVRSNGVVSQFAHAFHPDFLLKYTPWQTWYATDLN